MPIRDSDLVWRPSAMSSSAIPTQNGGRMAFSQITSGVKNNLFPDVSRSERAAGATTWRKAFIHINSDHDTALLNARLYLDSLTPAGDYVVFQIGTQTDTEDQITGRPYGIGALYEPVTAGATQIKVVCEHNADYAVLQPFRVGDSLRISDRPSSGGPGNDDWVTISAVSYGQDFATINLSPALTNNYAAMATLVSSVYEIASVAAGVEAVVVTSAGGIFADGGNLVAHNKGSIQQNWVLTFTSGADFTVSGDTLGALTAPGSIHADYAPINPATGTPYFTIKSSAWGGTFQAHDRITFTTNPAAIPVWYRRCVPQGTESLANDFCSLAIQGESA